MLLKTDSYAEAGPLIERLRGLAAALADPVQRVDRAMHALLLAFELQLVRDDLGQARRVVQVRRPYLFALNLHSLISL